MNFGLTLILLTSSRRTGATSPKAAILTHQQEIKTFGDRAERIGSNLG